MSILFDEPTRNVVNLVRNNQAFDTSVIGASTNVRSLLEGVIPTLEGLQTPPTPPPSGGEGEGGGGPAPPTVDVSGAISALETITGPAGALAGLTTHLTEQFSAMPQRLSLYMNQLNFAQGMGETPQFPSGPDANPEASQDAIGDICSQVENFFGSIMGAAQDFLNQITGLIGEITTQIQEIISAVTSGIQEAINAAVSALNDVITEITNVANEISNMVQQELNEIANALSNLLGLSNGLSLRGLFNHPCVRSVLGATGTPALLTNLSA